MRDNVRSTTNDVLVHQWQRRHDDIEAARARFEMVAALLTIAMILGAIALAIILPTGGRHASTTGLTAPYSQNGTSGEAHSAGDSARPSDGL